MILGGSAGLHQDEAFGVVTRQPSVYNPGGHELVFLEDVSMFFPLLRRVSPRSAFRLISLAVAAIGTYWLVERIFVG